MQAGSLADIMDLTGDDTATESCTICLEDVALSSLHVVGGCLHRFFKLSSDTHSQEAGGPAVPYTLPPPRLQHRHC